MANFIKEWMLQALFSGDSVLWIKHEHSLEKVYSLTRAGGEEPLKVGSWSFCECLYIAGDSTISHVLAVYGGWRPDQIEDSGQLVSCHPPYFRLTLL